MLLRPLLDRERRVPPTTRSSADLLRPYLGAVQPRVAADGACAPPLNARASFGVQDMACILRIGGEELDPDALLTATGLPVYRVDRKGSPQTLRSRGNYDRSSVHVEVSGASMSDLPEQVRDAVAFLEKQEDSLRDAVGFAGVEYAVLDFAVEHRDVAIDSKYLPLDLLVRAGHLGITIELSIYPEGNGG